MDKVDSITASLFANSIRRRGPNNYSDTQTSCLMSSKRRRPPESQMVKRLLVAQSVAKYILQFGQIHFGKGEGVLHRVKWWMRWQSLGCQGIKAFLDGETKVAFLEGVGKGRDLWWNRVWQCRCVAKPWLSGMVGHGEQSVRHPEHTLHCNAIGKMQIQIQIKTQIQIHTQWGAVSQAHTS